MQEPLESANTQMTRRTCLAATGGALLAATALPAAAAEAKRGRGEDAAILYGHGMVWNHDLPGVAGRLHLSFDLRVNLETGVGFGTAHDPVNPDYNIQFAIESVHQEKVRGGEQRFALAGFVTDAVNPDNIKIGTPVKILAETRGDTTAIAIALGEEGEEMAFAGAGLVVIAIIAILIGLLLPAVQKVR